MFRTLGKLVFFYIVLTLLFSDFSSLTKAFNGMKEPSGDLFRQQAVDVKSGYNKFVDYVDDTVIPTVDTFFEENGDKNLADKIFDKIEEPFSVSAEEPMLRKNND